MPSRIIVALEHRPSNGTETAVCERCSAGSVTLTCIFSEKSEEVKKDEKKMSTSHHGT